jgi:hypothetical protein
MLFELNYFPFSLGGVLILMFSFCLLFFLRFICLVLLAEKFLGIELLLAEFTLEFLGALLSLGGSALSDGFKSAADVSLVAFSDGLLQLLIVDLKLATEFLGVVHLSLLLNSACLGAVIDLVGECASDLLVTAVLDLLVGFLDLLADLVGGTLEDVGDLFARVLVADLLVVVLLALLVVVAALLLLLELLVDAVNDFLLLLLVFLVGGALTESLKSLLLFLLVVPLNLRLVLLLLDALLVALALDVLHLGEVLSLLLAGAFLNLLLSLTVVFTSSLVLRAVILVVVVVVVSVVVVVVSVVVVAIVVAVVRVRVEVGVSVVGGEGPSDKGSDEHSSEDCSGHFL